jgi:hypothetical protein
VKSFVPIVTAGLPLPGWLEEPDEPEDPDEPELPPAAEEPSERRHWWQRRPDEPVIEPVAETPRHVRVLPAEADEAEDPWEHGFGDDPVSAEAEEIGDDEPELVEESGGRRFFRRR